MFTITPARCLLCLTVALLSTIIVRFLLRSKRDLWFRRSVGGSIFTQRGVLGQYLALGYPVTPQGVIVWCALLLILAIECYFILIW